MTEKGLVITDRPEKYPIVEKLHVRNGLHSVRVSRFPTRRELAGQKKSEKERAKGDEERKQRVREIREKMRSTQVSRDFVDLPLTKILAGLSKIAGVTIVDGASSEKPELTNKKLSVRGGSRSVEKVLHSVLAPLQLDYHWEEGCFVVRPREVIEEIRTDRELQEKVWKKALQTREKKQREILSRRVTLNPRNGSRLGSFVDDLSRQLALPVYTDRDAWRTRLSFRRTTRPATFQFNDLARVLKKKGVELAVDLDYRVVEQGGRYDSFALYILKPSAWYR